MEEGLSPQTIKEWLIQNVEFLVDEILQHCKELDERGLLKESIPSEDERTMDVKERFIQSCITDYQEWSDDEEETIEEE